MPNLPTTEELRKAGEQAVAAVRTPLLAALGAGDLAAKAVVESLNKARERAESAKTAAETTDLKVKLDPAELRKAVDAYTHAALNLYQFLAEHGEQALEKLKTQPQLQKALHQVEEAVETAQKRTGAAAADARVKADDVLGKVTRRTRTVGEKVANDVDDVSEKLAETVVEVGGDVAAELRSTTRKAADRTAPRKPAATAKPAAPTKTAATKTTATPKGAATGTTAAKKPTDTGK